MLRPRTLAQHLGRWLEETETTQRQLADDLGVHPSRVSRWARGREVPTRRQRDGLAERLGLDRAEVDKLCEPRDPVAVARAELAAAERAIRRAQAALR
jgi:transcriptional regulator with XRE-family HTH domain